MQATTDSKIKIKKVKDKLADIKAMLSPRIEASAAIKTIVDSYRRQKQAQKLLKNVIDEKRDTLMEFTASQVATVIWNDRKLYSVIEVERNGFDLEQFRKDHPELAALYSHETSHKEVRLH